MSKVLAIIQARLNSQRLPNKVLLQIPPNSGVSMLELVVRKAMLATMVDKVCVVTPDKELVKLLEFINVDGYIKEWEGRDVLREYYGAAAFEKLFREDHGVIVRLTADCPMLSPEIIDKCIEKYFEHESSIDLVYNSIDETGFADGQDVEVFSYAALRTAHLKATEEQDREHVTRYIRRFMRCLHADYGDKSSLSVNTIEDYHKICDLIKS